MTQYRSGFFATVVLLFSACLTGDGYVALWVVGTSLAPDSHLEADGWRVSFEEMVVAISDLRIEDEDGGLVAGPVDFIARAVNEDTMNAGGDPTFEDITAPHKALRRLSFALGPGLIDRPFDVASTERRLWEGNGSIIVRGTATLGAETRTFDWMFTSTADFICEGDFGQNDLAITLKGDRLFRTDPTGADTGLAFQPLADADSDGDGEITRDELRAATADPGRYPSPSPSTLWSVLEARMLTMVQMGSEATCQRIPPQP